MAGRFFAGRRRTDAAAKLRVVGGCWVAARKRERVYQERERAEETVGGENPRERAEEERGGPA